MGSLIISLETILNDSLFKISRLWQQLTLLVTRWITQIYLLFFTNVTQWTCLSNYAIPRDVQLTVDERCRFSWKIEIKWQRIPSFSVNQGSFKSLFSHVRRKPLKIKASNLPTFLKFKEVLAYWKDFANFWTLVLQCAYNRRYIICYKFQFNWRNQQIICSWKTVN